MAHGLRARSALTCRRIQLRWYSSLEVYDPRQDIQEATDEVKDGSSSAVRDDARTELPALHKHLRLAQDAFVASR